MRINTLIIIFITLFFFSCCQSGNNSSTQQFDSSTVQMVQDYMTKFPQSQLCDVYKFFFQDVFGPEHLVDDSATVEQYILSEIANADTSDWSEPLFIYPVGMHGNFVRVDLNYVRQGIIPSDWLAVAFVKSSKGWLVNKDSSLTEWKKQWSEIQSCARFIKPQPKNFEEDSAAIAEALNQGRYALHHSELYNNTYHQHYRIIRKDLLVFDCAKE